MLRGEYMTAIELLNGYRAIQEKMKGIKLNLYNAEADRQTEYDRLLRCSNFTQSINKHLVDDTGKTGDPVGESVTRIVDLFTDRITNLNVQYEAALFELKRIENIIDKAKLNEAEWKYIRLRFIEGLSVWKVEGAINYESTQAWKYKNSALDKIERAMQK
jgi:hypothetical protein